MPSSRDEDAPPPWHGREVRRRRPSQSSSAGSLRAPANDAKILPSRLIDVSAIHASNPTVSVIETSSSESGDVKYAALSYCWRANETNMLTGNSSGQIILRVSTLAPTIQDAVSITKRLGLKYIWIDAFCILQDSQQDKEKELGKMSHIYANAEFVIAASAAADSSERFVAERDPLSVNPCLIAVRGSPGKSHWT